MNLYCIKYLMFIENKNIKIKLEKDWKTNIY